jgi:hypothetical protein
MFKKIIYSFQANFIVALLTLAITLIAAKNLGAFGKGYLSVFAVYVSIIQLFNEILGVGTAFFLLKNYRAAEILFISYLWFVMISFIGTVVISNLNLLNEEFNNVFFFNTLFVSVFTLNLRLVLNKIKIIWYNLFLVVQPLMLLFLIYYKGFGLFTIKDFIYFQTLSFITVSIMSLISLSFEFKNNGLRYNKILPLFKESFTLGILNQSANFAQIINYRLSYFFLEKFQGLKSVGVFSIILSFANVIWLFAVSTGTLLGNEISKEDKLNRLSIHQFLKYIKISIGFSFIALLIVYLIPNHVYINVLSKDFAEVKPLILLMAPAILIFTLAKILGYFFSSLGKMKINLYSSISGILPSVILGYILIKKFKIIGAVASCSISFIVSSGVLIYFFWKENSKIKNLSQ